MLELLDGHIVNVTGRFSPVLWKRPKATLSASRLSVLNVFFPQVKCRLCLKLRARVYFSQEAVRSKAKYEWLVSHSLLYYYSEWSIQSHLCLQRVCVYEEGGVVCRSFWFDSMMSSWASGCTSPVRTLTSDTNIIRHQWIHNSILAEPDVY